MKVLIAHDRDTTQLAIKQCLLGIGIDSDEIECVDDCVKTKACLESQVYDLLIIDLTLPHIMGLSQASYESTQNLLAEIFELEILNAPGDIIGITKEPLALNSVDTDIGQHLMTVLEEGSDTGWEDHLVDRVGYVRKSSASRQNSYGRHFEYDVIILTALDKEMAPYNEFFEMSSRAGFGGLSDFVFTDKAGLLRKGLAYSIDRAGVVSAASITQSLISRFRPRLILMSGFCGGFADKKVSKGDLIFFKGIIDWDSGRWGDGKDAAWLPRPTPIPIDRSKMSFIVRDMVAKKLRNHEEVLGKVKSLSNNSILNFSYKFAPMASGSSLVAHKDVISKIVQVNDKAVGVDMESYGVAYACKNTWMREPDFLVMKSVSDFADEEKDKKVQEACSYISAAAALEIISSHYDFNFS